MDPVDRITRSLVGLVEEGRRLKGERDVAIGELERLRVAARVVVDHWESGDVWADAVVKAMMELKRDLH